MALITAQPKQSIKIAAALGGGLRGLPPLGASVSGKLRNWITYRAIPERMINCQHADVCLQRFKNYLKCKCCFATVVVVAVVIVVVEEVGGFDFYAHVAAQTAKIMLLTLKKICVKMRYCK